MKAGYWIGATAISVAAAVTVYAAVVKTFRTTARLYTVTQATDAVTGKKYVGWDLAPVDGLPDLGPDEEPTAAQKAAGAQIVPFYGYGKINLRFDPTMALPDGIMLPLQVDVERLTYKETSK